MHSIGSNTLPIWLKYLGLCKAPGRLSSEQMEAAIEGAGRDVIRYFTATWNSFTSMAQPMLSATSRGLGRSKLVRPIDRPMYSLHRLVVNRWLDPSKCK